jgi:hypothetical protein
MPDEEKQWYEVVKHDVLNPDPATSKVVSTVRGLGYAERMAEALTERLTAAEKEAGFAVYLREDGKPPDVDLRKQTAAAQHAQEPPPSGLPGQSRRCTLKL